MSGLRQVIGRRQVTARRLAGAWLATVLVASMAGALPAQAAEPVIEDVEARTVLGQPVVFTASVSAGWEPVDAELLLSFAGDDSTYIIGADLAPRPGGGWTATATLDGHVVPNTPLGYRFRIAGADGSDSVSAPATTTVSDERFDWQTLSGEVVRLHWYSGGEEFGRRALQIGEDAIAHAAELLGVTETEPIDFFIYDNEADMRLALGPGTRENVGGQAHSDIRTLFALIGPAEINDAWVDTVIIHELTHLVFNTATQNVYNAPPRWLNEGVAVWLSEGYTAQWRSVVQAAAGDGSIIPLDGLAGLFPTSYSAFSLAYGESVSAVDFFIAEHGEETLWQLVRSYADGVADDDAFVAATGADVEAFNAAWMRSLGLEVPQPLGPRPAPPGPLPAEWGSAQPTPAPAPTEPGAVRPSPPPSTRAPAPAPSAPPTSPSDGTPVSTTVVLVGAALLVLGLLVLLVRRERMRPPPPD